MFFRPTSVSPFLSSMSEFLSFRIPAQSMLQHRDDLVIIEVRSILNVITPIKMLGIAADQSALLQIKAIYV